MLKWMGYAFTYLFLICFAINVGRSEANFFASNIIIESKLGNSIALNVARVNDFYVKRTGGLMMGLIWPEAIINNVIKADWDSAGRLIKFASFSYILVNLYVREIPHFFGDVGAIWKQWKTRKLLLSKSVGQFHDNEMRSFFGIRREVIAYSGYSYDMQSGLMAGIAKGNSYRNMKAYFIPANVASYNVGAHPRSLLSLHFVQGFIHYVKLPIVGQPSAYDSSYSSKSGNADTNGSGEIHPKLCFLAAFFLIVGSGYLIFYSLRRGDYFILIGIYGALVISGFGTFLILYGLGCFAPR